MFLQLLNDFVVIDTLTKNAFFIKSAKDVLDFLMSEDGGDVQLPQEELLNRYLNNPFVYERRNGKFFSVTVKHCQIYALTVTPTILVPRCLWCGNPHFGGPEFCESF